MTYFEEQPDGSYVLAEPPVPPTPINDQLINLLANLPGAALITDAQRTDALAGALVPDGYGVWPGKVDYVPTYDVYYAATSLLGFLRAQPVVRQSSSEGTSVAVDAPSWDAITAYFASQSPINQALSSGGPWVEVGISNRHVRHTDMTQGGGSYGVDTDLG